MLSGSCGIRRISCNEIKRLYGYGGSVFFTDSKDHKVKTFDPLTTTVKTLMVTGHEGTGDGTEVNYTFTQVQAWIIKRLD